MPEKESYRELRKFHQFHHSREQTQGQLLSGRRCYIVPQVCSQLSCPMDLGLLTGRAIRLCGNESGPLRSRWSCVLFVLLRRIIVR